MAPGWHTAGKYSTPGASQGQPGARIWGGWGSEAFRAARPCRTAPKAAPQAVRTSADPRGHPPDRLRPSRVGLQAVGYEKGIVDPLPRGGIAGVAGHPLQFPHQHLHGAMGVDNATVLGADGLDGFSQQPPGIVGCLGQVAFAQVPPGAVAEVLARRAYFSAVRSASLAGLGRLLASAMEWVTASVTWASG